MTLPTIGWLFLLQVITAFGLAAAVLATGSRLIAAAGAGVALATLGGYLLSAWVGLFERVSGRGGRPGRSGGLASACPLPGRR